ncbi:MAG: hypothetical protein JXD21_07530 [Candidatus Omnitrophica bacterium]|nr:hypothetical protein [Candidatus Omnitrophota bacterium]
MKKLVVFLLALVVIAGCTGQKAESSKAAIEMSKAMDTVKAKTDYLITQAKAFYNSKDFQQAINIAQYVIQNVDKDSQAAKDLLEKAKAKLQEMAQGAMGDMKNKMSGMGK